MPLYWKSEVVPQSELQARGLMGRLFGASTRKVPVCQSVVILRRPNTIGIYDPPDPASQITIEEMRRPSPGSLGSWVAGPFDCEPDALLQRSELMPERLTERDGRVFWLYRRRVFSAQAQLTAQEVSSLILHGERTKARRLERVLAAAAAESDPERMAREPIPEDVRLFVWSRDKGRCVRCGATTELEFDHVIPLAMAGSNTAKNLQLLCASCNRSKGPNLA